ncbi:MAG: hypothetical protein ACREP9_18880 [Candidatus Dormibacteraceae bacterium]
MVDSTAGDGEVERREFAKVGFVGALGVLPGVDLERLHSILTGTWVDEQSLDQLAAITQGLMCKSWNIDPQALLEVVNAHFRSFGNVLLGVPSALSSRAFSMAGEAAFLAGYLSLKSGRAEDVDFYWQASNRMAQCAGDNRLRTVLLMVQSWQAEDEGKTEQALKSSEQAQLLLGANPEPVVAALTYSTRAYDFAMTGKSQEASRDTERAEHYLGVVSTDVVDK